MPISDVYSKLAIQFRSSKTSLVKKVKWNTQHPSNNGGWRPQPHDIAQRAHPQRASALVQLPTEIKEIIFQELWNDAGLLQHLILRRNRILGMKCITDIAASDELQQVCEESGRTHIRDPVLWRRLESPWGVHWKCEELYQSALTGGSNGWRPFLPVLFTCKQLYVDSRASIYRNITFCIQDLDTAHCLSVSCPSLIFNSIQHLQLTVRLPLPGPKRPYRTEKAATSRWRQCCEALDRAENLSTVYLWLDADPRCLLYKVTEGNMNPYVFGENLAAKLMVDLPLNPERPEAWEEVANIEPRFTIHPRGWPAYNVQHDDIKQQHVWKWPDDFEPGVPLRDQARGGTYVHPGKGLISATLSRRRRK